MEQLSDNLKHAGGDTGKSLSDISVPDIVGTCEGEHQGFEQFTRETANLPQEEQHSRSRTPKIPAAKTAGKRLQPGR